MYGLLFNHYHPFVTVERIYSSVNEIRKTGFILEIEELWSLLNVRIKPITDSFRMCGGGIYPGCPLLSSCPLKDI